MLAQSIELLKQPCLAVQHYLEQLTPELRTFFYKKNQLTSKQIQDYKNCDQKGWKWWEGKSCRTSGSMGAAEVGHNYLEHPVQFFYKQLIPSSERSSNNKFTEEGNRIEPIARAAYCKRLEDDLDKVWNTFGILFLNSTPSRDSKQNKKKQAYIWFRGHRLLLFQDANTGEWLKPRIEMVETGVLIDIKMPWRCASLDVTVYINGIARWIAEFKAPQAYDGALYPLWKLYYADQVQNNLHTAIQHYPEVDFCDVWIFNEHDGGDLMPFYYQPHYFWTWYFPRECRFYFGYLLPALFVKEQQKQSAKDKNIISSSLTTLTKKKTQKISTWQNRWDQLSSYPTNHYELSKKKEYDHEIQERKDRKTKGYDDDSTKPGDKRKYPSLTDDELNKLDKEYANEEAKKEESKIQRDKEDLLGAVKLSVTKKFLV